MGLGSFRESSLVLCRFHTTIACALGRATKLCFCNGSSPSHSVAPARPVSAVSCVLSANYGCMSNYLPNLQTEAYMHARV